jgi:BirA family biotin operon repressor/biotin-[acetyl-CoA-carboxylase] ligase
MSTRYSILKLLADGAFHSGTVLGECLGVSRAAVNKAAQALVQEGLDLHSIPGRGYRLGEPFFPLSAAAIRSALAGRGAGIDVEVLDATDSTSAHLLRADAAQLSGRVCLAEVQSAGRGRRGRGWVATPFHNLVLSIGWRFEAGPAALSGLSLAAGVAVLRALELFGVRDCGLKWPNDILLGGRKLAGLLVDLRGEAAGPSLAVLGLGLNVHLAEREAALIDQPWASLREQLPGPVDRNRLAALVIAELADLFRAFEHGGFEPWRGEWEQRHLYQHQPVRLLLGEQQIAGTVVGIDAHGGLRLRDARGEVHTYHSGEVSLRAAS